MKRRSKFTRVTDLMRRTGQRDAAVLVRRGAEELRTLVPIGGRKARRGMREAFVGFETARWRSYALSQLAVFSARLEKKAKDLAADDAAALHDFCAALLAAAARAEKKFRPAAMQSYVDVSLSVAAIRGFARQAATAPLFAGDPIAVTAAVNAHAGGDRAAILAHASLLLDAGRVDEAVPLVERALRINAVCSTAQQMLARAVSGVDYDLRGKFCPMPFTHLSTSFAGDAFACCCSAWLPYKIGNVLEAPSADAIWNSAAAAEIRRSIHDGDFRYCSRTLCSYIAAKKLPEKSEITDPVLQRYIRERTVVVDDAPSMLQMNHDQSCNLACPSCRTGIVTAGPAEQASYLDAADRVLLPLLKKVDGMTYISGGGEAFASTHYRKILGSLNRREYPHVYILLITNGLLLTEKRWTEFPDLPEMIGNLAVSVDAARAETYERLRRPGKWAVLMENLESMAKLRASGRIVRWQLNFVVQADNFRELPEFYELGNRLGVDGYWLQRLTNYGSYAEPVFARNDVTSPAHPDHAELLEILRQPWTSDPRVNLEMLMPFMPEKVSSTESLPWLRRRLRREVAPLRGPQA